MKAAKKAQRRIMNELRKQLGHKPTKSDYQKAVRDYYEQQKQKQQRERHATTS